MTAYDRARGDIVHLARMLTAAPVGTPEALEALSRTTPHVPTQAALQALAGALSFAAGVHDEDTLRVWRERRLAAARRDVTAAVCSRETIVLDREAAQ